VRWLGAWVIRRRDAAIDEYQDAQRALVVAQHADVDERVRYRSLSAAQERVLRARGRVDRWSRAVWILHGDGSRS
jgi:hypothetical protein